jgi:D-alanine-D-alanine ligase-like ATP-grasp enzyme
MQKKKLKKESYLLGGLLEKLAPQIGASVFLEPRWGIAGQITFANGKRSYFRYNSLDLNPVGSSDISRDKGYSNLFMAHMGYPIVPNSKTFFSKRWATAIGAEDQGIDAAYEYAQSIGFPVVVKPNSGSQGTGVAVVDSYDSFYAAMNEIFERDKVALVQSKLTGHDYRLVVLDNEVISAYERFPLHVIGDGTSTIQTLIEAKQETFYHKNRDTRIHIKDRRIVQKLQEKGYTLLSVPEKNEQVDLLDNANLSTGGDSLDVTTIVHPDIANMAITLTKDMGLRLCGVDIISERPINQTPGAYWILEINEAPGLDHYVQSGETERKIAEELYLKVLHSLESRG